METTPPPSFIDEKMAGFNLRADSSLGSFSDDNGDGNENVTNLHI